MVTVGTGSVTGSVPVDGIGEVVGETKEDLGDVS